MRIIPLFPPMTVSRFWCLAKDGDAEAMQIFRRHYTFRAYADGRPRRLFVGPGQKMVLITPDADALFVWRKFISMNRQDGVNCAVFRNESPARSSEMIRDAMTLAWVRWPGQRLYTYVNPGKVRCKEPGKCFVKAGWRRCGETSKGLYILEAA